MNNQELNTIQHISLAVDFWNKMDTSRKINLINRLLKKAPEYSKTLSHISLADVADVINYPDLESDTLSIAKSMGFKHINTHDMALSKLMGGSKNALFKFEPIFILKK